MKVNVTAFDIDDYDVDIIEGQVIATLDEELKIRYGFSFKTLEEKSQLALVSEIFKRLKNDIENEVF